MLVKLGDVWVNPHKVEAIEVGLYNERYIIRIVTEKRSYDALRFSEESEAFVVRDALSLLVNNAGQSFGGDDEKPKEE